MATGKIWKSLDHFQEAQLSDKFHSPKIGCSSSLLTAKSICLKSRSRYLKGIHWIMESLWSSRVILSMTQCWSRIFQVLGKSLADSIMYYCLTRMAKFGPWEMTHLVSAAQVATAEQWQLHSSNQGSANLSRSLFQEMRKVKNKKFQSLSAASGIPWLSQRMESCMVGVTTINNNFRTHKSMLTVTIQCTLYLVQRELWDLSLNFLLLTQQLVKKWAW